MSYIINILEEGRFGGPQARVVTVAEKLSQMGVETLVVYPSEDSALLGEKLTTAGVRSRAMKLSRLTKEKWMLARYITTFIPEILALWRLIRAEKPSAVHVNGGYQIKGAIAGKLAGAPVVWHLNDTHAGFFVRWLFKSIAWWAAAGFIIACRRVADCYLTDGVTRGRPVAAIHAPVDTAVFDPAAAGLRQDISSRPGLKVLTITNINPVKGIVHFVRLADILSKTHPDIMLLMGGAVMDSQKRYAEEIWDSIRKLGLNNVEYIGPVKDVPSALNSADICVCTSLFEASPTSVWEAMAMAKPVVATDVGGVPEFIENGVSGFITPPGDPEAMAKKVAQLAADPELRQRMGQAARRVAIERLSVADAARLHKDIYNKVSVI